MSTTEQSELGWTMTARDFPHGLTVAELRRLIATWPDTNAIGKPTEVWVANGEGVSGQVMQVWPLDQRLCNDGSLTGDLLLQQG